MTPVRIRPILLAALLVLAPAAAPALAEPFAVRLGMDRIVLNAPAGFSDTGDLASPRLQDLAASLTSASNRILLFALSDADVRRFTLGDQLDARRYMLAAVARETERERTSAARFAELIEETRRTLGKPAEAPDLRKFLDKQPAGRPNLIAELRRDAEAYSVLRAALVTAPEEGGYFSRERPGAYLFSTSTLLLINGKVLQLTVYAGGDFAADPEWVKSATARWIEDLQRLNR